MPKLNVGSVEMGKVRARGTKGDRGLLSQLNARSSCDNFDRSVDNARVANQALSNGKKRSITYSKMD